MSNDKEIKLGIELTDEELMDMVGGFEPIVIFPPGILSPVINPIGVQCAYDVIALPIKPQLPLIITAD